MAFCTALTGFSVLGGGFAFVGGVFALSRDLPMTAGGLALLSLLAIGTGFCASAKLRELASRQP